MNASGWIQLALFVGIIVLITKPLGIYLFQVLDGKNTFLEPVIGPLERLTYRLLRVDERREQNWKQYAAATLLFSLVTMVFTYVILRLQDHLPFHGIIDGLSNKTPITPDLAFNTAASFTTNTNWQSYSGENTMSYFSQMVGLASHNFWSAALGIAVAAALVRGIARHESGTVGNFWVDLVRLHYYLLLPLSIIYAVFLLSQGIPQNFNKYDTAQLTEAQTIQVPKTDAANAPVKDAAGNVVLVDQAVTTQTHRGRPHRLADGDQDARHQRRRLRQRQRGASLREPDAALQLHPDALDLCHSDRADLLPRAHGQKPEAWLGRVGCDGSDLSRRCYHLLESRGGR